MTSNIRNRKVIEGRGAAIGEFDEALALNTIPSEEDLLEMVLREIIIPVMREHLMVCGNSPLKDGVVAVVSNVKLPKLREPVRTIRFKKGGD